MTALAWVGRGLGLPGRAMGGRRWRRREACRIFRAAAGWARGRRGRAASTCPPARPAAASRRCPKRTPQPTPAPSPHPSPAPERTQPPHPASPHPLCTLRAARHGVTNASSATRRAVRAVATQSGRGRAAAGRVGSGRGGGTAGSGRTGATGGRAGATGAPPGLEAPSKSRRRPPNPAPPAPSPHPTPLSTAGATRRRRQRKNAVLRTGRGPPGGGRRLGGGQKALVAWGGGFGAWCGGVGQAHVRCPGGLAPPPARPPAPPATRSPFRAFPWGF